MHDATNGPAARERCFSLSLDNPRATFAVFWGITFMLMLICTWPAIGLDFAHHDDCRFWEYNRRHVVQHFEFGACLALGRPIFGLLLGAWGLLIDNVHDLSRIRFFSLIVISLCASLWAWYLFRRGLNRFVALVIGFVTFALPGSLLTIIWVVGSPIAVGLLLAIVAGFLADRVSCEKISQWSSRPNLWYGTSSCLVLGMALLTYQPSAMFFLLFAAADLLFASSAESSHLQRKALEKCSIFALTATTYFLMQKWLFLPIVMDIDSRARVFLETTVAHKFSLTWDVYPKLELLIT